MYVTYYKVGSPFFLLTDLILNRRYRVERYCLIGLPLLIYFQVYDFEFVWDDRVHIQHPLLKNFSSDTLIFTLTSPFVGLYIPVTYLVWGSLKEISDLLSLPLNTVLHLANVVVHTVNGLLVYVLLRNFIQNRVAILISALIFLLHPIQVESVAFVSELRGLLAVMFGLCAIYSYMKSMHRFPNKNFIVLSLCFFLLALLSKPTSVAFVFFFLLIHRFYYAARWRDSVLVCLPYLIVSVLYIYLSQYTNTVDYSALEVADYNRPAIWMNTIVFYLYKLVNPIMLGAAYGLSPQYMIQQEWFYPVALCPLMLGLIVWRLRILTPQVLLVSLLFLAATLSTSGLITYDGFYHSVAADRYAYLALFPLSLGVAVQLDHFDKGILYIPTLIILISFSLLSGGRQIPIWQDGVTLWTHSAKTAINGTNIYESNIATEYYNKGYLALKKGKLDASVRSFNHALELNPTLTQVYMGLGLAYMKLENYEAVVDTFNKVISLKPEEEKYYYHLANGYAKLGKYSQSLENYGKAVSFNSKHIESYERMAVVFYNLKRYGEAWASLDKVKELGREIHPTILKALQASCPDANC